MGVTQSDIDRLRQLLNSGDRGAIYTEYAKILANSGGSFLAVKKMLFEAQISTYSGVIGGAAILGNHITKNRGHGRYPSISIDEFSLLVVSGLVEAIEYDVNSAGGNGIFNDQELNAIAYAAWHDLGIGDLFPGNIFRIEDRATGWSGLTGSSVIQSLFDGSFTAATANLFTPFDLIDTAIIGVNADKAGKQLSRYGFSQSDLPIAISLGSTGLNNLGYSMHHEYVQVDGVTISVFRIENALGRTVFVSDGTDNLLNSVFSPLPAGARARGAGTLLEWLESTAGEVFEFSSSTIGHFQKPSGILE